MQSTESGAFLKEGQVASYLGISVKKVQKYRQRGDGPPYHRLGRAIRYKPGDIDAWLESQRVDTLDNRHR